MPVLAAEGTEPSSLYLELVVNKLSTGRVVPVRHENGAYFVRSDDLTQVSLRTGAAPEMLVDLSKLDSVQVEYDSAGQRLKLTVPPDWLPDQTVSARQLYDRTPTAVSPGLLLNYDAYTSWPTRGTSYTSLWTEQRLFGQWGTLANTGVYRYDVAASNVPGSNHYLRYDTSWHYSDEYRMRTYTVGDLLTGALSWNSTVRLGGVSLARNFRVRPDIVTYPLPQFAGQASVPTAVDLFINGSRTSTGQVNPGPFTFNSVPFINGAGEATVMTTDALGRQVATTIPFYVANSLLQKGLSDYSLAVGAVRHRYGLDSFSYGKLAASGSVRYGLTDALTVEGHGVGGGQFAFAGAGVGMGVGRWGVLNFAATQSHLSDSTGQQYAAGYQYTSQHFSLSWQRTQRTAGYGDLSMYDLPSDTAYQLSRGSTQLTGALNLGSIGGTLGAGYFDVRGADSSRTRIANVSYTRPVFHRATHYASLNKTLGNRGISGQLQLIIPFGARGVVTGSVISDERDHWNQRTQYSRSVPSDGGFGWNLAYGGGAAQYRQVDATWRNRNFQVQGGAYGYGSDNAYTRWGDVQGSVIFMGGAVLPANRVDDAFVLIDTQGHPNVPVRYENQLIGKTDSRGHLLVPWAPSYYASKYEIDPLGLPGNVRVPVVEKRMAVRDRSGAIATFPVERIVSARIKLVDALGQPMKVGVRMQHEESGQSALIGWNGETYLEGLSARNHLRATLPEGRSCLVTFNLNVEIAQMHRVGPLICSE